MPPTSINQKNEEKKGNARERKTHRVTQEETSEGEHASDLSTARTYLLGASIGFGYHTVTVR